MSRFYFDAATPDDGQEMLKILENAPFHGKISLLYTRRPDAFRSFEMEGERVEIVVCRDSERGQIAGLGACATRQVFLNGRPETIGYLFGLRVRQEYAKKYPLLHRGYAYLRNAAKDAPLPLYVTTILEENRAAQTLLEKPRDFMPSYTPRGMYEVYALNCSGHPFFKRKRGDLQQARPEDADTLAQFLNEQGRRFQFFPTVAPNSFLANVPGQPALEDFYLLKSVQGDILACGAFWNQAAYKQYLVQGYGGFFKMLAPVSRWQPLVGMPALPKPGERLRFFTLSYWAVKDDDPALFRKFLDGIPAVAATYPFYLVGVHETHPLRPVLQHRPHISYKSRVYTVGWPHQQPMIRNVNPGLPVYLECGML